MAAFVAIGVTRPLSKVVDAAERLEAGDYGHPLDATGDDEVARLAQSFLSMREALQQHMRRLHEVDKVKSDFIALAGHELRTPLTIITGFNDLISEGALGDVPEQVQETSEIIKQQLTRLNGQVENILELTRFEQGTAVVELEPIDLPTTIRQAIASQESGRANRDLHDRRCARRRLAARDRGREPDHAGVLAAARQRRSLHARRRHHHGRPSAPRTTACG